MSTAAQFIPILMYHQIDTPPERGQALRGLVVSPTSFQRQMWLLKTMGYRGVSMKDLEPYLAGEKVGKVIGITFDDGYLNNYEHALPTLAKYDFTATCYVVSQLIGTTNSWDLGKVKQVPLMKPHELQAWIKSGMDVGSHTRTHSDLTQLDDQAANEQIATSKHELEDLLGQEVRHFCYPYGRFETRHSAMAEACGYISATTTQRGRALAGDHPMTLKRIMIARSTNAAQFAIKLWTGYEDRKTEKNSEK